MTEGRHFSAKTLGAARWARALGLALCLVMGMTLTALAQGAGKRLALVVGNSEYSTVPALKNASKDASDVAASLERLGFEVTLLTDTTSENFWQQLESFSADAEDAESSLFFFSGHAFQLSGANYLVPVEAQLASLDAIQKETWNLDAIIARLQDRNRSTLIFLDACRNNPLPKSVQDKTGGASGLARLQTGSGTFVAFATEPNNITLDGAGDNSPFTTALLNHIEAEGISISDMMIRVRNEVETATLRRQTPWDQSSLRSQFYFNPVYENNSSLTGQDFEMLAGLPPEDREKLIELLKASGIDTTELENYEFADADPEPAPERASSLIAEPTLEEQLAALETIGDSTVSIGAAPEVENAARAEAERVGAAGAEGASMARAEGAAIARAEGAAIATAQGAAIAKTATGAAIAGAQGAAIAGVEGAAPSASAGMVVASLPAEAAATGTVFRSVSGAVSEEFQTPANADVAIGGTAAERLPRRTDLGRVIGQEVIPDSEENRLLLAAIDPALVPAPEPEPEPEMDEELAKELEEVPADLARAVQTELARVGCYRSKIDGLWGKGSRLSATRFYAGIKKVPESLEPTEKMWRTVKQVQEVICKQTVTVQANRVAKAAPKAAAQTIAPTTKRNASTRTAAPAPKKKINKSLLGSGMLR